MNKGSHDLHKQTTKKNPGAVQPSLTHSYARNPNTLKNLCKRPQTLKPQSPKPKRPKTLTPKDLDIPETPRNEGLEDNQDPPSALQWNPHAFDSSGYLR